MRLQNSGKQPDSEKRGWVFVGVARALNFQHGRHGGAEIDSFIIDVSEQEIRREKDKARELRKTRWWQNRVAQGICHYCGGKFSPEGLSMDHLVPIVRGGRSTRGNVAPACKECNSKKKYLLPVEWEEYLESVKSEK